MDIVGKIIGIVALIVVMWVVTKTRKDVNNGSCIGCTGNCSIQQKSRCHKGVDKKE
ncbi:FeoB-associated Cys-rich membrane protein [Clostridium sp. DL1XJH146]